MYITPFLWCLMASSPWGAPVIEGDYCAARFETFDECHIIRQEFMSFEGYETSPIHLNCLIVDPNLFRRKKDTAI